MQEIRRATKPVHLLVCEAGTDTRSRFGALVGVYVDDVAAVTEHLASNGDDDRVFAALRELAFEIKICFAAKHKLAPLGGDWIYALMTCLVDRMWDPDRHRAPVIVHLRQAFPLDLEWLDDCLTASMFHRVNVRMQVLDASERRLLLPELVARVFHAAVEDDPDQPSAARARYDELAPFITRIEDVGRDISYFDNATSSDELVRTSLRS